MAGGRKGAAVAVALVVALLVVAAAPGGAGAPLCDVVGLSEMRDKCRSYCGRGSTEDRPSKPCCDAVRAGAAANGGGGAAAFRCLCRLKGYLPSDIDAGRAMQIPSKCNIPGAPSRC